MKRKPLLVYVTRHRMLPAIAEQLTGYDILHLPTRYKNPWEMADGIAAACGERRPQVIMWIFPTEWLTTFILLVRERWPVPGVQIVQAKTYMGVFEGYFTMQGLSQDGRVYYKLWYPQGPVDTARQKKLAAEAEARKTSFLE